MKKMIIKYKKIKCKYGKDYQKLRIKLKLKGNNNIMKIIINKSNNNALLNQKLMK